MRAFTSSTVRGWSSLVVVLLLTGCGGGSGGGGGGGGGSALVYSGISDAAVITGSNSARLVTAVFGGGEITAITAGASIESSGSARSGSGGLIQLTRLLDRVSSDMLARAERVRATQQIRQGLITVDIIQTCDSGAVRISGNLEDDRTGTLSVSYDNCLLGTETHSGAATLRIDLFDVRLSRATDYTLDIASLAIRGPGVSQDVSGSRRVRVSGPGGNVETITENLTQRNNLTGKMTRTENFVTVNVYASLPGPSSVTQTVSGRVFVSVDGFVDFSTSVPLFFSTLDQPFPEIGQVLLVGSTNRAIRITARSAEMVTLELDFDGDGLFEGVAILKWTELSTPIGADLADSDGDGMHNSWETAHGLNKNDPADALQDRDGDGASNLAEYQGGSDPNNPGSIPPVVGLSLSVKDTPDPVVVGGNLSYSMVVTNSSLNAASNVVLTNTLPASVTLTSPLQPTQGSCSGTTTITCNFGTLGIFGTAAVVIGVSPTAEGVINNTASVTTSSFDPNTSDNSATTTTVVGQPTTGIQAQIDSAVNGQTILVGPGIYVGGLNFNGKNITLQSSAGPASTIIHGNQVPAAQIGPLGAIKGFTITGSGIDAIGQGALISGNIFDGNVRASSFGVAIKGNNASPTIERNIFRNITCDTQFLSAVIVTVNSSSPLINNNVFENNQCRGIDMTLPQGNAPQVVNNTFVGNRTAIRVDRRVPQTTQIYRNNLIVQNGIGLEIIFGLTDADNPVWENNLVFGNTVDYQGTASQTGIRGNISANPMFINGPAGNYKLQAGSPAINSGSSVGAPGVDFDGTARPIGGSWDIGAFEAP